MTPVPCFVLCSSRSRSRWGGRADSRCDAQIAPGKGRKATTGGVLAQDSGLSFSLGNYYVPRIDDVAGSEWERTSKGAQFQFRWPPYGGVSDLAVRIERYSLTPQCIGRAGDCKSPRVGETS